ncbi:hypothetical protein ASE56_09950 [Microbacterium sp. Leaf203]|nr:hypothetical protein ASE56_09950 [Microbacterium sp. Leaf203]
MSKNLDTWVEAASGDAPSSTAIFCASEVIGSPGRDLVPELEICTSSSDSRCASTSAASGDRHTLPVHTVKILSTEEILDPLAWGRSIVGG